MTITETVNAGLRNVGLSAYERQAASIVTALEEREAAAVQSLVAFAEDQGLSSSEAYTAIEEAGLSVPAPEVEATAETTFEARIAALEARLAKAEGFATRHGYRA